MRLASGSTSCALSSSDLRRFESAVARMDAAMLSSPTRSFVKERQWQGWLSRSEILCLDKKNPGLIFRLDI